MTKRTIQRRKKPPQRIYNNKKPKVHGYQFKVRRAKCLTNFPLALGVRNHIALEHSAFDLNVNENFCGIQLKCECFQTQKIHVLIYPLSKTEQSISEMTALNFILL